jgi:Polysaccharide pyruvyl transferase
MARGTAYSSGTGTAYKSREESLGLGCLMPVSGSARKSPELLPVFAACQVRDTGAAEAVRERGKRASAGGRRAMIVPGTKILIACDTTANINWGARGASLALQQLLACRFENIRTLPGEVAGKPVFIDTVLPPSLASPLLARRYRSGLTQAYYRFEQTLGMKSDYIELDPMKSAQNILKNKDREIIRDIYTAISEADVVVVDGDGDLIFRTPPGRIPLFNLAVIELASRLGKAVHYVNSIFSDCPMTGRNERFHQYALSTLSKCSTITLRDPASIRLARSTAPELKVHLVPDSLFLWYDSLQDAIDNVPENGDYVIPFPQERLSHYGRIRFDRPYICLSGSSYAAFFQEEAVEAYTRLANAIQNKFDMGVYLAPTCNGDRFMHEVALRTSLPILPPEISIMMSAGIVAKARVYITGRYHPAIMAALGGTPCVFLGADSHKTSSLQELLEYDEVRLFSALPTPEECNEICDLAAGYLSRGEELRSRIRRASHDRAQEAQRVGSLIQEASLSAS